MVGLRIRLDGMEDTPKQVEYWDTYSGSVVSTAVLVPSGGSVTVSFPSFEKDVAVKVNPGITSASRWTVY